MQIQELEDLRLVPIYQIERLPLAHLEWTVVHYRIPN